MPRTIFSFAAFVSLKLFPNKSFSKQLQVHFVVFAARALKSTFSPVELGDQDYFSTFFNFFYIFFNSYFLAAPHSMWDPSPWNRDRTCEPCIGSTES